MNTNFEQAVIFFGCLVVAVILHEVSHGVVASFFGDDTAKRAGRLTLNPIPHIDPVGSIVMPAMGALARLPVIGWAKPVPVNPARLRDPRRDMFFVSLAGPTTNFLLMAVVGGVGEGAVRPEIGAVRRSTYTTCRSSSRSCSRSRSSTCSSACSTCSRSHRSTARR